MRSETEADWDLDIKEDVEAEVSKYGQLKHIFVDKNSQVRAFGLSACWLCPLQSCAQCVWLLLLVSCAPCLCSCTPLLFAV